MWVEHSSPSPLAYSRVHNNRLSHVRWRHHRSAPFADLRHTSRRNFWVVLLVVHSDSPVQKIERDLRLDRWTGRPRPILLELVVTSDGRDANKDIILSSRKKVTEMLIEDEGGVWIRVIRIIGEVFIVFRDAGVRDDDVQTLWCLQNCQYITSFFSGHTRYKFLESNFDIKKVRWWNVRSAHFVYVKSCGPGVIYVSRCDL